MSNAEKTQMRHAVNHISKTNFVFFGTTTYAAKVLDTLKERGYVPSCIITTPDSPQGRKLVITPPPVKNWANAHGIRLLQPEKLHADFLHGYTSLCTSADFFIVAAYGKIIPEQILTLPRFGTLNIHPSLLPRWRGPSPVQYTILSGDTETGVTVIELDTEIDHGPIVAQKKFTLSGTETAADLDNLLWSEGALLLAKVFDEPERAFREKTPQDHSQATFSKKIEKSEAYIPPEICLGVADNDAAKIWERRVRAYFPSPLVYTILKAKSGKEVRVQILKAHVVDERFIPHIVKPEGKKEMPWEEFKRGNL